MTIGLSKDLTVIGLEEEVTEGTYIAPQGATSYVQPLADGYSIEPAKDLKERNILTAGFTKAQSRVGQKSVTSTLNVELRASGTEGTETDADLLLKGLLGGRRQLAARITSGVGHTTTVINLSDTSGLVVGDIVVVLESGAHHISPITAITTNTDITLLRAAASAFSDNVEIAKFTTYYPSNTLSDYPTLSMSAYHGDEILESASGLRPVSMAVSNFTTGELASLDFSLEGTTFSESDASAPHTPSYDSGVPPLILSSCIYQDSVQLTANNFSLSIENSLGFLTSTCSEDGRISSRWNGKRAVTGSVDPYKDDTSVANFTRFDQNTVFSLFAFAATPSTTAGEYDLGTIMSFYLPNCILTSKVNADADGVLIENLEFEANGGEAGDSDEIFVGLC